MAASILTATTLASPCFSDLNKMKLLTREAQKMVHSYPDKCESWIQLAAAVRSCSIVCNSDKECDRLLVIKTARLALVKGNMTPCKFISR